ncbi:MAG: beta-lactamase family protein [Nitriliruptoraceae bacterium]|nr:beta-lactamase family protein [Nitriliruptoraceae bacterium]
MRRSRSPVALVAAAVVLAACLGGEVTVDVGSDDRGVSGSVGSLDPDLDPDLVDDIAALLVELLADDVPGVVVSVGDLDDAHLVAHGLADLERGTPVRVDDVFRIASVTKPMVAAAVLSYVESGALGLDTPVASYLDAALVARLANAEVATVRQLLQMTSGIPDYLDTDAFWVAVEDDPSTFWTPVQVLGFASGSPADHAPGAAFTYSNSNDVLAQLLLEELGGEPLAEVLRRTVFDPAGMDGCSVETADTFPATTVRGYDLGARGDLVDVTASNDGVGLGDGGVVCDVESLARFLPALVAGEILGPEMLEAMLDSERSGADGSYGLGVDVDVDDEFGLVVGHDGASSGFQAMLRYAPDDGVIVALLTNSMAVDLDPDLPDELLDAWVAGR